MREGGREGERERERERERFDTKYKSKVLHQISNVNRNESNLSFLFPKKTDNFLEKMKYHFFKKYFLNLI